MIETRLLRNAIMLAEYRNFARAAQRLNISQPTLTRNIQTLENRIGARLFDRKARAVLPTPAGEELLKHARLIISSTLALEDGMQHYLGLKTGRLSIGADLYAASSLLGPAIGRFREQYPNVRINIETDNWLTLYDRLKHADFDFILAETSGLNEKQDLEAMNLIPHQGFFFCRRGHPLLKTTLRTPGDLLQFPLILPTLPERLVNLFRQLFEIARDDLQTIEQMTAVQCNDISVIKDTVSSSNAIGIATHGTLREELKRKLFMALPFRIPALKSNYGISKKQGLPLSPAASAFIDIVVETDAALSEQEAPFIESLYQTSR
ncbi:MAG: LysR family transcriptional regulator [Pseudomonadota bacterium]